MQFRLSWLMIAFANLGLLSAWLNPASALALAGLAAIFAIPAAMAQPERRIRVAAWVLSLYPVMAPVWLYTTWLTAWCLLGHRPRPWLDDPKYLGALVNVPFTMTAFSLLVWPISMCSGLLLAFASKKGRFVANPLLILTAVWLLVIAFLLCDPLRILDWMLD